MALESLRLVAFFAVDRERVYRAWLDGDEHGKMTGAEATGAPRKGSRHTAWDGYIEGKNLELSPPGRIVQSWRTSEFADGDVDSRLVITLREKGAGTELVLEHTDIPEGQGAQYESGWEKHYFAPMRAYFAELRAKPAATKKSPKESASKKPAATTSARAKKPGPTSSSTKRSAKKS